MGQEVKNLTRFCQIPHLMNRGEFSTISDRREIIVAASLITVLAVSALSTYLLWVPPLIEDEWPDKLVCITSEYFFSLEPTRGSWVVSSLYDTLVSYNRERTDRFRPLLVTEVPSLENGRISPDGRTYRFTIRNDSPLTPEDVEYSIERAMVCGEGSTISLLREVLLGDGAFQCYCNETGCCWNATTIDFEDIDNAVEAEGNDVVIHLTRMDIPFMNVLASSSCSILSKAWCVEHGDWPGTEETLEDYIPEFRWPELFDAPLDYAAQGFGPFILERLTMADVWPWHIAEMVLVRNEDYWRGPARLKSVEIKWIGDWETRKQMLLDGDADVCSVALEVEYSGDLPEAPKDNYTQLVEIEGIRVYTGLPTLSYTGLYFNFMTANNSPYIGSAELDGNGVPPDFFNDIDIRKAFAYSIDYDTIINEIYAGEAQQPASPVIEGLSFRNPDQECYTYDLDKARQHFQQAWGGEVWNKGFNVTLPYFGKNSMGEAFPRLDMFAIGELISSSFKVINANFHVTLEPIFGVAWNQVSFCIDYHSPGPGLRYLTNQESPNDEMQCGFGTIFHGYNGSPIDDLIEAGMNTLDPAERQVIYNDYQRIYHEEVPGVPLVQPLTRHYQRDCVWGWYYNPAAAGMNFYEMLKGTCQDATRNIIAHVENLVDGGVMGAYAGSSLTETLDSVIAFMDNGTLTEASQLLNDFIDQVNALDLPVWDSGELTALAQEIIEVLTSSPTPTGGGFDIAMIPVVGGGVATTVVIVLVAWKRRKIE
jgi:peptide/nickel transport system substrate-binding protein